MNRKSQKQQQYDGLSGDLCIALLNECGFRAVRRATDTIAVKPAAIEVSVGIYPLGAVYIHTDKRIPVRAFMKQTVDFVNELAGFVGVLDPAYIDVEKRVRVLCAKLPALAALAATKNVPANVKNSLKLVQ